MNALARSAQPLVWDRTVALSGYGDLNVLGALEAALSVMDGALVWVPRTVVASGGWDDPS
jgi:hypothetical protein